MLIGFAGWCRSLRYSLSEKGATKASMSTACHPYTDAVTQSMEHAEEWLSHELTDDSRNDKRMNTSWQRVGALSADLLEGVTCTAARCRETAFSAKTCARFPMAAASKDPSADWQSFSKGGTVVL